LDGENIMGFFDSISDFIGTGGGDQGLLNVIDEGVQAGGKGLAEVDDFVNNEIPGGYILPAALAVALATGYYDPSLFASEAGFTGASETGLATLAGEGAAAYDVGLTAGGAPLYDFSPGTAIEYISPELDPTGSLAAAAGLKISPMQALRGLSLAKGLLGGGGGQESAIAPATQFRGARMPQGQVDYSGILNLLQMQSPQRRSLLG
jgi:hypothetical protein